MAKRTDQPFAALLCVLAVGAAVVLGCTAEDPELAGSPVTGEVPTASGAEATTVAEVLALERPVVLAHAGGENVAPNSTPFAYGEAVAAGVDVLDADVRLTGDGVLVVNHDEDVDRTTDSTGDLADMTYAELRELDNAFWFTDVCSACTDQPRDAYRFRGVRTGEIPPPDGYTPDDFAITSLEDLLQRYPDRVFNIEIKGSVEESRPAAEELARILIENDHLDAAVVTAKDDDLAEAFHELAPEVVITPGTVATNEYVNDGVPLADGRDILQVPPEYQGVRVLTRDLVERANVDGHVLWVWPNDRDLENAAGYKRLFDMGVHGINANDPAVAVEVARSG